MNLTPNQIEILDHTVMRAAGQLYCGDSKDMRALIALGLMVSAGWKSFVPDEYFTITGAGQKALRESKVAREKLSPEGEWK